MHCCWSLRKWLPYIVSRMSDTIRFSHHSKPKNTFLEIFFIHSKSKRKHLVHFIFSKHLLCWKWQFSCRRTTILDKCNRFGKFRDKESQPNIRTNTYCNERERVRVKGGELSTRGWERPDFIIALLKEMMHLPVLRAFFRNRTFTSVVIVNLTFHATQFLDVLAKIANDKFLTTGRVRKTGMGQFLTVWAKYVFFRTEKTINAL